MIEINNLCAKIKDTDKEILKGVSLNIKPGEVHAIMGPNGTGKSTLSKVILGNYMYEVTDGDILFSGESIIKLPVYERARKGIFLCMQDPTVIDGVSNSELKHPTQKPVELLKYLIETYTNENETVLDNCMGSGSTGVACVNTNRDFIGIELDKDYFNIAKQRITGNQK